MYQGGTYLRGLWKRKPQAWGPRVIVRAYLRERLESLGIDWASVILVLPFWGPGNSMDYGPLGFESLNTEILFKSNSCSFDSSKESSIKIQNNDVLNPVQISILAGIKPVGSQETAARIVGKHAQYNFNINNYSRLYCEIWSPTVSSIMATEAITLNKQQDVAFTKDSDTVNFYYNDGVVDSTTKTGDIGSSINFLGIGGRSGSVEFFNGNMSYVFMFNTTLSDSQTYGIQANKHMLWQPPVFRTYFIPTDAELSLILANISQSQSIDNVDLLQQAILSINSIDQSQVIDNITLSLSQNLIIAGISQSQIIDNISLIQQIALVINSLQQNQVIDSNDLIQQALLNIQELSQAQVIDNLTLLSATILTIAELNQAQKVTNLDLLQQSNIIIADNVQSQLLDNIVLLYGDVLAITGISQSQTSDNIALVQQNLLSVADINQMQTTDNVTLSVAGLLEIANLVQTQNLDIINLQQNFALAIDSLFQTQDVNNIILDSSQILAIQKLVQNQLIDVISLVQQSVLNVDEISQQQILDNIEIVITRISGKLSITFQLKTPGGRFTLR